ncbi:P-II family nitrogen regulator [Clostridium sp. cel8]|uniref:P-II family nitrogen regulator n=1 Tax=Clostridium sp. cel8 TaxID=2663123 RepID=UPI0015F5B4F4|nr:P-II family nitrogen regulator [Clostridium sp. cel8]MBA5851673.1 P-II family nitrogen regulator [Clostridium sp. cel8]
MKEVMAVIRMDMVGKTKEALAKAGFPSITCKKVVGRGKKKVGFSLIKNYVSEENIYELESKSDIEQISEAHRLISKRLIIILVKDEDAEKVINTIIEVNKTGNPGDGKIFVTKVTDAIRIRTEKTGDAAI